MQCPKTKEPLSKFDRMCNEWYEQNKYTPFRISVQYNSWFDSSLEFFLDQFNSEAAIPNTQEYLLAKNLDSIKNILKEKL